ncbi:conserved hypothetical protein [Ricinus communis]|uniref:Uncharacterized protein n=1 Tax=Ricinus communis TaxID=3988 RepID=B9RXF8_RICCO|nr:conserved hypothetical protein [Ricinus communis]
MLVADSSATVMQNEYVFSDLNIFVANLLKNSVDLFFNECNANRNLCGPNLYETHFSPSTSSSSASPVHQSKATISLRKRRRFRNKAYNPTQIEPRKTEEVLVPGRGRGQGWINK